MPLYEYHCQECQQQVTIWRSFSDTSSPRCPVCGSRNLTRLISQVAIVKSGKDRVRDVSWIDRNLARRLREKAGGKLSPAFEQTLDKMESK